MVIRPLFLRLILTNQAFRIILCLVFGSILNKNQLFKFTIIKMKPWNDKKHPYMHVLCRHCILFQFRENRRYMANQNMDMDRFWNCLKYYCSLSHQDELNRLNNIYTFSGTTFIGCESFRVKKFYMTHVTVMLYESCHMTHVSIQNLKNTSP